MHNDGSAQGRNICVRSFFIAKGMVVGTFYEMHHLEEQRTVITWALPLKLKTLGGVRPQVSSFSSNPRSSC
jgi:hypothetical protein